MVSLHPFVDKCILSPPFSNNKFLHFTRVKHFLYTIYYLFKYIVYKLFI